MPLSDQPPFPGPWHKGAGRLDAVDFWRGFVLVTILINHVPGTPYERLTYRNVGFSDSAEAFVFISGLSLALAYGRRFALGSHTAVLHALMRRTLRIYGTHIGLSAAAIAIFAAGAVLFAAPGMMEVHGRDLVAARPVAAVVGVLTMGHQFGYFNILPLYVVLLAAAPLLFLLARGGALVMLGASLGLYLVSRLTGLALPTWPIAGTWFLNPFAWQFIMAIGMACGLGLLGRVERPSPPVIAMAAIALAVSAFCATDGLGLWPGLFDTCRATLDLDKTSLGLGRLVHFLLLAYLVVALRLADRMRSLPWHAPLCVIGRHGLASFAMLSLLSAIGQVVTTGFGHTLALDTVVVAAGLLVLYGTARLLDARKRPRAARPAGYGYLASPGGRAL